MALQSLREVLLVLVEERVEFIVFGAIALMAHGLVRATQDLDIFVRPQEGNIARLRTALKRIYPNDSTIDEITHADLAGEYPAVRYNAPDGFGIDIVSRLGNAWAYDDIEWERKEFDGLSIPVATPATLYRMKKDTLRWKDKFDAQALRERFDLRIEGMAVKKYRSVADMEDLLWAPPGTPLHQRAVRLVIDHVSLWGPTNSLPCGVFKFRSVEEARAKVQAWEQGPGRAHQ